MSSEVQNIETRKNDEISLKELIIKLKKASSYIFSKWYVVLIAGTIGGGLGFFYAYMKKPIFVASTSFVLESGEGSGGGMGQYSGIASMVGIDLGEGGGGIFQGDNILELYKSRNMIEKTLLTPLEGHPHNLILDLYFSINDTKKSWINNPDLADLKFSNNVSELSKKDLTPKITRLRDSILGAISDNINRNYLIVSKPDKKLAIIRVDVKSKEEAFAKVFNDAIVKNVNDFYVQTKTKKSLENLQVLQHQVDSVRNVMNGNIYTVASVSDATPNLNPTRQVQRIVPSQRAQFSAETNKTILGSLVQNLEITKMTLLKETPLIQVIDTPRYPLKYEKLGIVKGSVLGVILASLICVCTLLIRRIFNSIMKD